MAIKSPPYLKGFYVALSLPDDEFTSNDNDKYKYKDTGKDICAQKLNGRATFKGLPLLAR